MKWRVVLTVLFVLTLFAGFAYLYVNTFVRKHQHAVILFVVNGLDLKPLNMARHHQFADPADAGRLLFDDQGRTGALSQCDRSSLLAHRYRPRWRRAIFHAGRYDARTGTSRWTQPGR